MKVRIAVAVAVVVGGTAVVAQARAPVGPLAAAVVAGAGGLLLASLVTRARASRGGAAEALPDPGPTAPADRDRTALEHTSEGVVVIDPEGEVEYANAQARSFLAERVLETTRRLRQPDLDRIVAEARRLGEVASEDVTLWTPGPRPARARAVPLADGSVVLLLGDLSESYRLDQVRRDFVSNVSHELKTPAAAIRALAETAGTALEADDIDTVRLFVERLGTEASRLSGLVADLLDLSRVEVGRELLIGKVDLGTLLEDAVAPARAVAEVKGIGLVVHPTDAVISGDPSQLSLAVKNLVDNAVRYSEHGKVEVGVEVGDAAVTIGVADQGIGIPADDLHRIFERFYRVDKARSRATGGTGLGLAIVRHIVENHGGKIEVESELGLGSTFRLVLPAEHRPPAEDGDP